MIPIGLGVFLFSDFNHDGFEDFYVANGFFDPENDRFFINDSGIISPTADFSGKSTTDVKKVDQ